MRDIDDAAPLPAQALNDGEELLRLAMADRRGRLVHEDDFGVVAQRLGDLDQLRLSDGEAVHAPRRGNREAEVVENRLRRRIHFAEVDPAEPTRRLAAEKDILGDRHLRNRAQFLLDDGDARRQRLRGTAKLDLAAVAPDFTGVAPV